MPRRLQFSLEDLFLFTVFVATMICAAPMLFDMLFRPLFWFLNLFMPCFQFSLRTLLCGVTCAAAGCLVWTWLPSWAQQAVAFTAAVLFVSLVALPPPRTRS